MPLLCDQGEVMQRITRLYDVSPDNEVTRDTILYDVSPDNEVTRDTVLYDVSPDNEVTRDTVLYDVSSENDDDHLHERFDELVGEWKEDTLVMSLAYEMAMHPAYQRIIGMGPTAVPLILSELESETDHWFWALHAITGADPVPEGDAGNLPKMSKAWIDWGRRSGYRW